MFVGGGGGVQAPVYAFVWGLVHVAVSPGVLNSADRPSLLIHDRQQVHSKVGNSGKHISSDKRRGSVCIEQMRRHTGTDLGEKVQSKSLT